MAKGEKLNLIIAKKLQEKGLQSILLTNDQVIGKYVLNTIKDENGENINVEGNILLLSDSISESYFLAASM